MICCPLSDHFEQKNLVRCLRLLGCVLTCLTSACIDAEDPVVAEVGSHQITAQHLRTFVEQFPAEQPMDLADKRQYLQPLIDRYLLEADNESLDTVEVRVYRQHLERALPDSLIQRKNQQRGELLSQRGAAFLKQGRLRRALTVLSEATTYAPALAQAYFYRGLAHARLDENELAVPAFERAVALAPDRADFHYALGTTLQLEHRYEDAAARLQLAIALRADRPHYYFRLGEAHRSLASFDRALAAYDSALALQPDHAEALYRRSDLLARSGNYILDTTKKPVEDTYLTGFFFFFRDLGLV